MKHNAPLKLEQQEYNKIKNGFTLIELVIILVVISILVTIAIPEVMTARKDTKGLMAGAGLSQIEAAKSAWKREFPGEAIRTTNDLIRYMPNGFPKDPWGVGFSNTLNLNAVATHPRNGIAAYEPEGASPTADTDTNGVLDWLENGFNDLGKPSR